MANQIIKTSVLYYTRTGNTAKMAQSICEGMTRANRVQARSFTLDGMDTEWVRDSRCVIVGTPTYMASVAAEVKTWLDGPARGCNLAGKIGGAFATANYVHGGADLAIRMILDHMMVFGMLTYSAGASMGRPVIHLGPVAIAEQLDAYTDVFRLYGERMAAKTAELFG